MKYCNWRAKVSGTPVDNQIASYPTECDYLVTGDRSFAALMERLSIKSPVALGKPIIMTPVDDVVARVEAVAS
jgi:hypothetical protein